MGRRVAEEQLTWSRNADQGYQVVELRPHVEADAVVVAGRMKTCWGHTIATGPLLTPNDPEEVYRQPEGRPRAPAE